MKRLLVLLLLSSNLLSAQSAPKVSVMVYFEDKELLLPIFEKELKMLTNKRDQKIISEVKILNNISTNKNYESQLREAMSFYPYKNYDSSESIKDFNAKVIALLENYDYLIIVKASLISTLAEYQLYVYKPLKTDFPQTDILSTYYSSSFILDLSKENAAETIRNELQKVFPETNYAPVAKYKISGRTFSTDAEVFVALGDTLEIDATYSEDFDTPRESLSCQWKQLGASNTVNVDADSIISLNRNGFVQRLSLTETGTYVVAFKVSDRISESVERKITIQCRARPKIQINHKSERFFRIYSVVNLIQGKPFVGTSSHLLASTTPPARSRLFLEKVVEVTDSTIQGKMEQLEKEVFGNFKDTSSTLPSIAAEPYPSGYRLHVSSNFRLRQEKRNWKVYTMSDNLKSNELLITHRYNAIGPFFNCANYNLKDELIITSQSSEDSILFNPMFNSDYTASFDLNVYKRFGFGFGFSPSENKTYVSYDPYLITVYKGKMFYNVSYMIPIIPMRISSFETRQTPKIFLILAAQAQRYVVEERNKLTYLSYANKYWFCSVFSTLSLKPFKSLPIMLDLKTRLFTLNQYSKDYLSVSKSQRAFAGETSIGIRIDWFHLDRKLNPKPVVVYSPIVY
jgi:hypothetical protein